MILRHQLHKLLFVVVSCLMLTSGVASLSGADQAEQSYVSQVDLAPSDDSGSYEVRTRVTLSSINEVLVPLSRDERPAIAANQLREGEQFIRRNQLEETQSAMTRSIEINAQTPLLCEFVLQCPETQKTFYGLNSQRFVEPRFPSQVYEIRAS